MDEAYEHLVQFRNALAAFHERLLGSQRELERRREALALWQDAGRRWHDERWLPHEEGILHFLGREGPEYLEFLDAKIHSLKEYLDG